jgi:hypothetical protein
VQEEEGEREGEGEGEEQEQELSGTNEEGSDKYLDVKR